MPSLGRKPRDAPEFPYVADTPPRLFDRSRGQLQVFRQNRETWCLQPSRLGLMSRPFEVAPGPTQRWRNRSGPLQRTPGMEAGHAMSGRTLLSVDPSLLSWLFDARSGPNRQPWLAGLGRTRRHMRSRELRVPLATPRREDSPDAFHLALNAWVVSRRFRLTTCSRSCRCGREDLPVTADPLAA